MAVFYNQKRIIPNKYPSGEFSNLPKDDPNQWRRIEWYYESDDEFMLIAMLASINLPAELYMPYIPYCRQDHPDQYGFSNLKMFGKLLDQLGFSIIYTIDPHSDASLHLLTRTEAINPQENAFQKTIYNMGIKNIFFPDSGAMKKYWHSYSLHDAHLFFGAKIRDDQTGEIIYYDVVDLPNDIVGSTVAIVDDICSKGTTFLNAAKELKARGANKVCLFVTHCENNIHNGELLKNNGLIDEIYTYKYSLSAVLKPHKKIKLIGDFYDDEYSSAIAY